MLPVCKKVLTYLNASASHKPISLLVMPGIGMLLTTLEAAETTLEITELL